MFARAIQTRQPTRVLQFGTPSAPRKELRVPSLLQTSVDSRGSRLMAGLFPFTTTASGGIYDITVKDIDNRDLKLSKYAGKVILVVNVASNCGFTPQYNELVELDKKYGSKGLVIIGAPCNQFGAQEPGSNAEIKQFAAKRGAKFPMLSKLDVNGPSASPLYKFLKEEKGGLLTSDVKWNFSKFLVDKEGKVVERYFSTTTPTDIAKDIEKYL